MNSLKLQIHEFSREFIDVREKDGKLVSGGFGASEIAKATYPVPDKIKQVVNRGDLRINDSYPPSLQEFALLAKEIDEYAILAVATREHDDKNRPLIAYRYFWLEKPQDDSNNDIDGIGTLILWWDNSEQPKFTFQKNSNANNLQYHVDTCSKKELYNIFNQSFGTIFTEFIAEIKLSPYVVVKNYNDTNSYFKLHYLTLHLHREFKAPISWAWNVGILENPKYFTNIWVANQNTSNQIASEIKHQKLIESQNSIIKDLDNTKPEDEKLQNCFNNQPKSQPQKAPHELEKDLKQLILKAVNNNDINNTSYLLQIVIFIDKNLIHDCNKNYIIDKAKFHLTNHSYTPEKEAVIYRAILVYLGFDNLYEWAQWLKNISSSEYEKLSFEVQIIIRNLSIQNQSSKAYQQLKDLMFHNYSNLLFKLSSISVNSKEYKYTEWLLFDSKSIWNYYLKQYTQKLVKSLIYQDSNLFYPDNKLYQELITCMSNRTSKQQHSKQDFYKYKSLGILLKKLENNSLLGLFYQLSEGAVPKKIYSRVDVEIIPLNREYTAHPIRKLRSFICENQLIIVGLLFIFISLTGISWIVVTKYLPQQLENTSK